MVIDVQVDIDHDLALIEVSTEEMSLHEATLGLDNPAVEYGKTVFVAANPVFTYRTLKKGIISAPTRFINKNLGFEVDAGITFGSSGGGVFSEEGKLIGTVGNVASLELDSCFGKWDEAGNFIGRECVKVPMTFMGLAIHPSLIRDFIKRSVFCEDLGYECDKDQNGETIDE